MKTTLLVTLVVLLTAGGFLYLFRDAAMTVVGGVITADMFVEADAATLNVGVPVGERLPDIRAVHDGRTVTDLTEFAGPNGLVLVANRSIVW